MGNIQVFQLIERKKLQGDILSKLDVLMAIDQKVWFRDGGETLSFESRSLLSLVDFGYLNQPHGQTTCKIKSVFLSHKFDISFFRFNPFATSLTNRLDIFMLFVSSVIFLQTLLHFFPSLSISMRSSPKTPAIAAISILGKWPCTPTTSRTNSCDFFAERTTTIYKRHWASARRNNSIENKCFSSVGKSSLCFLSWRSLA